LSTTTAHIWALAVGYALTCGGLLTASDPSSCTPNSASIPTCVTKVPWISQYDPRPGTRDSTRNCGQTSVYMIWGAYNSALDVSSSPCPNCLSSDEITRIDAWLLTRFNDSENIGRNGDNGEFTSGKLGCTPGPKSPGCRIDRLPALASGKYGFVDSHYYEHWTIEQLQTELQQGHPVIVGVWTFMDRTLGHGHWMVLVGLDDTWV